MKNTFAFDVAFFIGCVGAISYSPTSAANFTITKHGSPKAEIIVTSQQPEAPLTFAAHELQRYVKEISGAELSIAQSTSNKPTILLSCAPFQKTDKAAIDAREADRYCLSIDKVHLRIQCATPRAVLFVV